MNYKSNKNSFNNLLPLKLYPQLTTTPHFWLEWPKVLVLACQVFNPSGESSDLLLKIHHLCGGVRTMIIQCLLHSLLWTLEIIEFVKKHVDVIGSMRRCMWLSLRLSLWPLLRLRGWGFHVFRIKGEVINIFINVATLMSSVLTFYSLFFSKTTKMCFAPRHRLSRDLVFSLHHWQTGGIQTLSCHMIDIINLGKGRAIRDVFLLTHFSRRW